MGWGIHLETVYKKPKLFSKKITVLNLLIPINQMEELDPSKIFLSNPYRSKQKYLPVKSRTYGFTFQSLSKPISKTSKKSKKSIIHK